MGEVCLAEDTRLQRKVALKFLPAEFTQNSERLRRFELEAKTASGLNHPNIITIYDIGQAHNTHFIATEFIEGKTLRDRLRQPLSLNESLDIALQIANALAAAHEAQIIHRDIKPENVMLRGDGIVKVLDFGLAKLSGLQNADRGLGIAEGGGRNEDAETLVQSPLDAPQSAIPNPHSTAVGTVMGTASYMSPEQARGLRVDARTDIFSLGVVLSEMLAGKRPFDGVNMIDVLGAIMHETPVPLPDAPAEAQRIVTKALQKNRDNRYQTAQELARDLKELKEELAYQARLGAQASRLPLASEAMPTSVASGNAEEETISSPNKRAAWHALAARKMRALPVIALLALALIVVAGYVLFNRKATPALAEREPLLLTDFENKTGEEIWDGTLKQALAVALEQSPYMNIFPEERARDTLRLMNRSVDEPITRATGREICQRRNVRALLIGTIAKLERSYTVTLEATNAQSGETMARTLETAEGKDKVVEALGRAAKDLREKLGESLATLQKFDKPLEEATTSSLEALQAFSTAFSFVKKARHDQAILHYKRALELDDKFALAWAYLGFAYGNTNAFSKSLECAEKAYQLRDLATERERLIISASYHYNVSGDAGKMEEATTLLVQMYPQLAVGFLMQENYLSYIGQFERAAEAHREAMRIEPGEKVFLVLLLQRLNRFDEAREMLQQTPEVLQEANLSHFFQFHNAFARGDAAEMNKQVAWFAGDVMESEVRMNQAWIAASAGRRREADQLFQQTVKLAATHNGVDASAQYLENQAAMNALLESPQLAIAQATQFLSQLQAHRLNLRITATPAFFKGAIPLSFTFALAGDATRAEMLVTEFAQKYPQDTLHKALWAPLTRATIELQRGNPTQAVELLQPSLQYEAAGGFMPTWIRGQSYLQLKQGAQAAAEFQKIIDHRGWDVTSPLWPLAHLGLARAMTLQGDTAKAKQGYDEFFRLWKDADADLPVLIEAKKEYAKVWSAVGSTPLSVHN